MKRDYSKWCSVVLIAAIYSIAGIAGWLLFDALATNPLTANPLIRLFFLSRKGTINAKHCSHIPQIHTKKSHKTCTCQKKSVILRGILKIKL